MSNIVYALQQTHPDDPDEEEVTIDSNDLLEERLSAWQEEQEQKRLALEAATPRTKIVEEPVLDEEGNPVLDEEGNPVTQEVEVEISPDDPEYAEFTEGIAGVAGAEDTGEAEAMPDINAEEILAKVQEEADGILSQARMEAEQVLADAQAQADAARAEAVQAGHDEGFQQGIADATAQNESLRREIEEEGNALRASFAEKEKNLEHNLVDTICAVFEKVFAVSFADDKNVVLHLVDNALSNIEGSKQLLIRANEETAAFLQEKKPEMQDKVGSEVQIDIITDNLQKDGMCTIETDGGIFDCSIDTELRNLTKRIRSLT